MAHQYHQFTEHSPVGSWNMTIAQPDIDLVDCIDSFWEGQGELEPFSEKILPRATLELMINLGNPHQLQAVDGKACAEEYACGWLSGLQRRYLTVHTPHSSHLISVSLKPQGAWLLLRQPLVDVAGRVPLLSSIWGPGAEELRERLLQAPTPRQRFTLLENWLRRRLDTARRAPQWISYATERLHCSNGQVTIAGLAGEIGISRSLLHRGFIEYIGLAPKRYARLCRFMSLLQTPAKSFQQWLDLAVQAGYFDESHLYHDFRDITGDTPRSYWRQRTPDGSAILL